VAVSRETSAPTARALFPNAAEVENRISSQTNACINTSVIMQVLELNLQIKGKKSN
jgi:hypothetical protein